MKKASTTKTKKVAKKTPTTKADVARMRGKEPEGVPVVGRLKKGKTQDKRIEIGAPDYETMTVPIIGTSPLIVHAWGRKAIGEMLDKHMNPDRTKKETESRREAKDIYEDFLGSMVVDRERNMAIPSPAPKKAMLSACRFIPNVHMVNLTQAVFVEGEFSALYGQPKVRIDPVRVGMFPNRVADIRTRAEFETWAAVLQISFIPSVIKAEDIGNLLMWAGRVSGIGEWRPEKNGSFGTFTVGDMRDLDGMEQWNVDDVTPENSGALDAMRDLDLDLLHVIEPEDEVAG